MRRRPRTASWILSAAAALILALWLHAFRLERTTGKDRAETLSLIERLELSDLCLFPEAPHTRHPAVVDRHAAFRLHPLAFDPHPTGMFVRPPRHSRTP